MPEWKNTVNLPRTGFPMKANLQTAEPEWLARWKGMDLYGQIRQKRTGRPKFVLHDGPPYANGHIHIGHALNKILKDIIVKSKTMAGYRVPYVPGWDCHGLPIEHQVLKGLGPKKEGMSQIEVRRLCREYAEKFIGVQREEFKRLGVFGDWDNPYLTMAPAYQAVIAREFGRFVGRGVVYKGLKPVHWCMHCKTALAQAEVEYEEQETPSVYVKFPLVTPLPGLAEAPSPAVVIWTTTPWTLPANRAVALNGEASYALVACAPDGAPEALLIAEELLPGVLARYGVPVPRGEVAS